MANNQPYWQPIQFIYHINVFICDLMPKCALRRKGKHWLFTKRHKQYATERLLCVKLLIIQVIIIKVYNMATTNPIYVIAAAVVMAAGLLATGIVQQSMGSVGMGIVGEKPERLGQVLFLFVIPETLWIVGFVLGLILLMNIV